MHDRAETLIKIINFAKNRYFIHFVRSDILKIALVRSDILKITLVRNDIYPQVNNDYSAEDGRLTAFMTHGGAGSTMEATHAGTPLIVIPLFGDQVW